MKNDRERGKKTQRSKRVDFDRSGLPTQRTDRDVRLGIGVEVPDAAADESTLESKC